jgi:hypothetical protein
LQWECLVMKSTALVCLLVAALPLCALARSKHHESDAEREFKQEKACPSTGAIDASGCPGWTIGYFTPVCAGGLPTKENMYWIPKEDARTIRSVQHKHCKALNHKSRKAAPAY